MRQQHRVPRHRWRAIAAGSAFALVATSFTMGTAVADDGSNGEAGKPVSKSMINLLGDDPTVAGYVDEAEHAFIAQMKFYVPSQSSNGTVLDGTSATGETSDYYNVDGTLVDTRPLAKPLVGVSMYGPVETVDDVGFIGHGRRDAYASVSLDDGVTWKETNLSESADETSCDNGNCNFLRDGSVAEDGTENGDAVELFKDLGYRYPGDVTNMYHAIAGNKVLVAWPSRYCASGQPNYSLDNPDKPELLARRAAIAEYLGIDLASASPDDLYLIDMYGVSGSQGSVNYAEEDDYEPNQAVGEVPYSCLWTARGELVEGDDPRTTKNIELSYMRWFKAERLTSGVRDVNRIETVCVDGAGCAITWQEDPDGLRGGQGEGPGEGWSGAVANSGTDIWYSYIDMERFDVVQDPTDETGATYMTFADYTALTATDPEVTQKPKPFVPFAMPMRLSDNAKCNVTNPKPYCYGSALVGTILDATKVPVFPDPGADTPMDYGLKDLCVDTVTVLTGNPDSTYGQKETDLCVTEDGLTMVGNTAATRPRLAVYGYDSQGKVDNAVIDSGFVAVVAEEDKGLGAFTFDAEGNACVQDGNSDPDCFTFDEGKNIKYFTFSMSIGDKVGNHPEDQLLTNLAQPGHQLNQPEVDWMTGEFYEPRNTVDFWDFGDYNYNIYNTEIARRGSWLGQDIYKVHKDTSKATSGLLALPSWKQGQMNQGGPADVMSRRVVIPDGGAWKLQKSGNPYAFRNMQCTAWGEKDNPYYPGGLCLDSAINLSSVIPDTCMDSATGEPVTCPTVTLGSSTFGIGDTNPILQGKVNDDGDETTKDSNTDKVLTWHQCPASFTTVSQTEGTTPPPNCTTDARTDASTLADQSWYNPLDVAKGHRGFLDGDMVMMLYAWSPNWRLNAKGSDRYELYIRRSFTGARTWTTLPSKYTYWDPQDKTKYAGDGTVTCETYRSDQTQAEGELVEPRVCNRYEAGAAEQARNVTQLQAMRITTLDPRFAITGSPQGVSNKSDLFGWGTNPYGEDVRDPSRYFVVYETGDNTTTALGEPEPLDLFYSRAINFGDDYAVWAEETDLSVCYPSDPHADDKVPTEQLGTGFCNEFDQLEQGTPGLEASEASLTANPGGQFLYGAWAEIGPNKDGEIESDAKARRVWWIDGYIPSADYAWVFGQGSGDGVPVTEETP